MPGLHGQHIRCRHSRPGVGRRFRRSFVFYLREAGIDAADRPAGNRHPQGRPFAAVMFCNSLRISSCSQLNIMGRCQGNVLSLYSFGNGINISFRGVFTAGRDVLIIPR